MNRLERKGEGQEVSEESERREGTEGTQGGEEEGKCLGGSLDNLSNMFIF